MPLLTSNTYTGVAGRIADKYWFDRVQTGLTIKNNDTVNKITVYVADDEKTLAPQETFTFDEEFECFHVKTKRGTASFTATASGSLTTQKADNAKLSINVLSSMPPFADVPLNGDADITTTAIQARIDYIISRVKTSGFGLQASLKFPAGTYNISNTGIVSKPYIKLISEGMVTFKFTGTDGTCLTINNDTDTPAYEKEFYSRGDMINAKNGGFIITKPMQSGVDIKDLTGTGLKIGNDISSNCVSKTSCDNVAIRGFGVGLQLGTHDTYLLTFKNFHIEGNKFCIQTGITGENSGERMNFENCIFAGSCAVLNELISGWDFCFHNCSFDYNIDIARISSGYGSIKFSDCYFENEDYTTTGLTKDIADCGYLVNSLAIVKPEQNKLITFCNCLAFIKCKTWIKGKYINTHINGFNLRYLETDKTKPENLCFSDGDSTSNVFVQNITFERRSQCVSKGNNLIYNGDFEKSTAGQTLLGATPNIDGFVLAEQAQVSVAAIVEDTFYVGSKALKLTSINASAYFGMNLSTNITAKAGEVYVGGYRYALNVTTPISCKQRFIAYDKNGTMISQQGAYASETDTDTAKTWKYNRDMFLFVCPAGTASINFQVRFTGWVGDVYIDDIIVNKII